MGKTPAVKTTKPSTPKKTPTKINKIKAVVQKQNQLQ